MQRTPFDRLRPGMITASNVFSADGRLLIKTDVPLTEPYLQRLLQLGIPSVYTRNSLFEDNCAPELLSEPSRVSHIRSLQQQFMSVQAGASWDSRCFIAMADKIATEVRQNTQFMVQLTDIRLCNEFIYGHSVNVAVLCALIGMVLGYPSDISALLLKCTRECRTVRLCS
jgi:HD-GYP domain-containing protein (c-di-GMP phosphodiesterase class II)